MIKIQDLWYRCTSNIKSKCKVLVLHMAIVIDAHPAEFGNKRKARLLWIFLFCAERPILLAEISILLWGWGYGRPIIPLWYSHAFIYIYTVQVADIVYKCGREHDAPNRESSGGMLSMSRCRKVKEVLVCPRGNEAFLMQWVKFIRAAPHTTCNERGGRVEITSKAPLLMSFPFGPVLSLQWLMSLNVITAPQPHDRVSKTNPSSAGSMCGAM